MTSRVLLDFTVCSYKNGGLDVQDLSSKIEAVTFVRLLLIFIYLKLLKLQQIS